MNVGIFSSTGGHLTEALILKEAFTDHDCFVVTQEFPSAKEIQLDGVSRIHRIKIFLGYRFWIGFILSIIWATWSIFWIFIRERPKVIFSVGAEIAIPAFLIGRYFFGAKTVFVESLARGVKPSMTGKWVYPMTDLFLVQDRRLLKAYGSKAQFWGSLL